MGPAVHQEAPGGQGCSNEPPHGRRSIQGADLIHSGGISSLGHTLDLHISKNHLLSSTLKQSKSYLRDLSKDVDFQVTAEALALAPQGYRPLTHSPRPKNWFWNSPKNP